MRPDWERAVRHDDVDSVARLLTEGADIDARDAHGQTGLMLAVLSDARAVAALLAARGADLNHTAKFHLSALMLAVIRNQPETVRCLADAGADLTIEGRGAPGFSGKTALDLAEAASYGDIAAILRAAAAARPGM